MKLHADTRDTLNTVTAYGAGWIEINKRRFDAPVLVRPEGEVLLWTIAGFDALQPADFERLLAQPPQLVILGTGAKQRFPHPRLTASLTGARIGVEAMATPAACRTYNILMAEGRDVLAALLVD